MKYIEFIVYPGINILDLTGPMQVFATAARIASDARSANLYDVRVVGVGEMTRSSAGLDILTQPYTSWSRDVDTMIVVGGGDVHAITSNHAFVNWLQGRSAKARRTASVCTGAFLLAEAGLLRGRSAVTHWQDCQRLADRFPDVIVKMDTLFVRDGHVWTSAGVTAGIDMALSMVEEDAGHQVAIETAKDLVLYLKRQGGQKQFSTMLSLQTDGEPFDGLHNWISDNLQRDLAVPTLATFCRMSERNFVRRYRAATGSTPARAVERIRVEKAQHLLISSSHPIKRIARLCGFGSEETMRRSFMRQAGLTPLAFRLHFASTEDVDQ